MVGVRSSPVNMALAREHPEGVCNYLAMECSEDRVLGLLDPEEFSYVHMSHFGVLLKGLPEANKGRLIVDQSLRKGASINDGIGSHLTSLSYVEEGRTNKIRFRVALKRQFQLCPLHIG